MNECKQTLAAIASRIVSYLSTFANSALLTRLSKIVLNILWV